MDGGCGGAQPQRLAVLKPWENTDAFRRLYPQRPVFQTQPRCKNCHQPFRRSSPPLPHRLPPPRPVTSAARTPVTRLEVAVTKAQSAWAKGPTYPSLGQPPQEIFPK